jgi:ankyrin repeat protein
MRRAEAELVRAIDDGDVLAVTALLAADPALATAELEWSDGRGAALSSAAISYASMARFHGRADHDRAGEVARALLDGGAPVEGAPGAQETPIVTAASYDEPDVVRVLIERGADVRGRGFAAPGGTGLAHATYFGNGEVARILVEAGAPVGSVAEAIAAGVGGEVPLGEQGAYALRAAAVCDRPEGIERVLAVGVPVDAVAYGGTALQWAA